MPLPDNGLTFSLLGLYLLQLLSSPLHTYRIATYSLLLFHLFLLWNIYCAEVKQNSQQVIFRKKAKWNKVFFFGQFLSESLSDRSPAIVPNADWTMKRFRHNCAEKQPVRQVKGPSFRKYRFPSNTFPSWIATSVSPLATADENDAGHFHLPAALLQQPVQDGCEGLFVRWYLSAAPKKALPDKRTPASFSIPAEHDRFVPHHQSRENVPYQAIPLMAANGNKTKIPNRIRHEQGVPETALPVPAKQPKIQSAPGVLPYSTRLCQKCSS